MLRQITKPHMRKQWLKMVRGLMAYAVRIQMRPNDPSVGFKIKQRASDGVRSRSEQEIEMFRQRHPLGSRGRLAFELLLNTVQRRGDVIRMGRQHVSGDSILVTQQKTGAKLKLPLMPELVTAIEATPSDHLTFLTTCRGASLSLPLASVTGFASNVWRPGYAASVRMGCARPGVAGSPRLVALKSRSPLGPVTTRLGRGRALHQGRRSGGAGEGGCGQDANIGCQTSGFRVSNSRPRHWQQREIKCAF